MKELSGCHRIAGRHVKACGDHGTSVIDPATEERIGTIIDATPAEIEETIQVALEAQRRWNRTSALSRAELLHEAAHRMRAAVSVAAEMLTREMGKPYKESAD
jgi:betaine-aldehyde dehydrogenase